MSMSDEWLNSEQSISTNCITSIKTNVNKNPKTNAHNLNVYISPSTQNRTIKIGSPLTSRNLKNCLSFASIKQHKILQEEHQQYDVQTPKNSIKKCKLVELNKQNKKESKNRCERQTLTGIKQRRKLGTRDEEQSGKIVIESYKMQTQSLKQTVSILKQQISALKTSNKNLKEQQKVVEEQLRRGQQKWGGVMMEIEGCRKKEKEYESILPKIEELEQLQDHMIEENMKIKERETLLRELLAEVVVLVGGKQDETAVLVRQAIASRLGT